MIFACVLVAAVMFLPSRCVATIDTHTDTQTNGGTYEVRCSDGLRGHDIHTKFHKDWFTHSKLNSGGGDRHTESTAMA
jgi:hypothetical protein